MLSTVLLWCATADLSLRGCVCRWPVPAGTPSPRPPRSHCARYAMRSGVVTGSSPARRRSRGKLARTGAWRHRPAWAAMPAGTAPAPGAAPASCARDRLTIARPSSAIPLRPRETRTCGPARPAAPHPAPARGCPYWRQRRHPTLQPVITSARPSGRSTSIAARRRAAASRSRNGSPAAAAASGSRGGVTVQPRHECRPRPRCRRCTAALARSPPPRPAHAAAHAAPLATGAPTRSQPPTADAPTRAAPTRPSPHSCAITPGLETAKII